MNVSDAPALREVYVDQDLSRWPFDAARVAEGVMDRCCEGDPWPTLRNLIRVEVELVRLALSRCAVRVRHQPRSVLRWRRDPRYGGRA